MPTKGYSGTPMAIYFRITDERLEADFKALRQSQPVRLSNQALAEALLRTAISGYHAGPDGWKKIGDGQPSIHGRTDKPRSQGSVQDVISVPATAPCPPGSNSAPTGETRPDAIPLSSGASPPPAD